MPDQAIALLEPNMAAMQPSSLPGALLDTKERYRWRAWAQVLAQAPTTEGHSSQTILSGTVYPTNAAALSDQQLPPAEGARLDGGTPYHAFMWPVPGTGSMAAGSISATLYNDSRSARQAVQAAVHAALS